MSITIRTATLLAVCGAGLSLLLGLIHRFGIFPQIYGVTRWLSLLPDLAYLVFFVVLLNRQSENKPPEP
jgi:hypothetical protein